MKLVLPPLLAAFVEAKNRHDSAAFAACFTLDAVVHDEGQTYRGRPAIKAWFETVSAKYRVTLTPTGVATSGSETVLTADVAGNFPGSPFEFRYYLTLEHGAISALRIEA